MFKPRSHSAYNLQMLVVVITCFFAIAKGIAQYTGKEHAGARDAPTAVSPAGSETSHQTSLSSIESTPTPCSSPVAVTPQEISTRSWDSILNGHDASSYLAALKGVCVEWTLRFWSAERIKTDPDEMLVSLTDAGKSTHVYFRIPYKTYERFPLLNHDHLVHVHVKGRINRVDGRGIELTNAAVDLVK